MKRLLAFASLTLVLPPLLLAQEKKTTPAKAKDKAAEARAAVNEAKQDLRNKDRIKEAEAAIKKALKNSDAAKSELDRLKNKEEVPDGKDAKATIQKLKDSVDKDDIKELERLLKESTETMREEIKEYQRKRREEGKGPLTPAAPSPSPAHDPPPVSFDNVAAPAPIPLMKAPDFPQGPMVVAKHGIICGERDPRNPEVVLPENDPRRRMWVLSGNVRVRRPFMALDADEVDLLLKEGQSPDITGGGKTKPSAPSVDPAGRPKREDEPFERIVARGNVRVMFVDRNGVVKVARGGSMIFESKSGIFLIKEWPEAEIGDKLFVGPDKSSVIRLSDVKSDNLSVDIHGLKATTLERRLSAEDMPRTTDQQVPGAGAIKPKSTATPTPSSAPR